MPKGAGQLKVSRADLAHAAVLKSQGDSDRVAFAHTGGGRLQIKAIRERFPHFDDVVEELRRLRAEGWRDDGLAHGRAFQPPRRTTAR